MHIIFLLKSNNEQKKYIILFKTTKSVINKKYHAYTHYFKFERFWAVKAFIHSETICLLFFIAKQFAFCNFERSRLPFVILSKADKPAVHFVRRKPYSRTAARYGVILTLNSIKNRRCGFIKQKCCNCC